MIATTELAERIELIYHELKDLCCRLNKNIKSLTYELLNDTQEFVIVTHKAGDSFRVEITGLNNIRMTKHILYYIS
jgi:hypothetical protein